MVVNFQVAQNIRGREKEFQQAKFFQKELTRLVNKEDNTNRDSSLKKELTTLHSQIDGLEQKEMQMLESLQGTINEHRKLSQTNATMIESLF